MKLLETKDLHVQFKSPNGPLDILNGIGFVIESGETYGIMGESGCGKSITSKSIMRIIKSPGRILDGSIFLFLNELDKLKVIDILQSSETYMTGVRGDKIAMIFQEANMMLNPVLSITDQIGESFLIHRLDEILNETINLIKIEIKQNSNIFKLLWKRLQIILYQIEYDSLMKYKAILNGLEVQLVKLENSINDKINYKRRSLKRKINKLRKENPLIIFIRHIPLFNRYRKRVLAIINKKVINLLDELGIPDSERIGGCYSHELSGGMQQRIVIAIALACHPLLLIADEPTSNLDVTIQAQVVDLIKKFKKTKISSVLFISHDPGLIAEVCDRVTVMYAGDIYETATVEKLFSHPLHPYTQSLLKSALYSDHGDKIYTIPGTVTSFINPPKGCRFHPRCIDKLDICSKKKPSLVEYGLHHYAACHLLDRKMV